MDLVVLVADKSMEQAVRGILSRPEAIGMRPVTNVTVLVHPNRDPGVFNTGHELVAPFAGDHRHALLMLDVAWEGCPVLGPAAVELAIEERCAARWADRARCVAIDPELEVWAWSSSPHVADVLGFESRAALDAWLDDRGTKPPDPKAPFERALRERGLPPSSARFRQLAERVSFGSCRDAAFGRLLETLRAWFPPARRD